MHKKKPASFEEVGFKHLNSTMRLPTSAIRWFCGAGAHSCNNMESLFFHNLSMANLTQNKFFVNIHLRKIEYYSL